jgi:hypothetical protein
MLGIIWFFKGSNFLKKWHIFVLIILFFLVGQSATNFIAKKTGSMTINWMDQLSILTNPESRIMRQDIDYEQGSSWNVIMERAPIFLMPIVAPLKGFFMMSAPLPLNLDIPTVVDDVLFKAKYDSEETKMLFPKLTAMLFIFSIPFLLAALLDTYYINRRLWDLFPFTFIALISIMGFAVYGMIEPRYRPMLLLFWLVTGGIGFYYGKPKRYITPSILIISVGVIIYLFPKLF